MDERSDQTSEIGQERETLVGLGESITLFIDDINHGRIKMVDMGESYYSQIPGGTREDFCRSLGAIADLYIRIRSAWLATRLLSVLADYFREDERLILMDYRKERTDLLLSLHLLEINTQEEVYEEED